MRKRSWKGKLFYGSLFLHRFIARKFLGSEVDLFVERRRKDIEYHPLGLFYNTPREATLELMSREIYRYGIEGSVAELGVYRGDFASLINHYFPDRKLYLFDTFEGFDERDAEVDRQRNFSPAVQQFDTSVEIVMSKMEHPDNCIIRKGWFPETTEGIDDKFCFVNLDADLYQPMKAGLEFFYPRLVHGGVIILHDFNNIDAPQFDYKGVRQAVKEFCDANNIGYVCLSDVCGSVVIVK